MKPGDVVSITVGGTGPVWTGVIQDPWREEEDVD